VRGNLYAALVNYFHLVADDLDDTVENQLSTALTLSLSSVARDESLRDRPRATLPPPSGRPETTTSTGCLAVLKPVAERLVATVSRDATDGTEVWKTVAYMLLDCLVDVSRGDKHGNILSTLVRHGFLAVFVQDIKDSDRRLQSVLKPEPGTYPLCIHLLSSVGWWLIVN
jgi:nuclear pore complex protein Nup205